MQAVGIWDNFWKWFNVLNGYFLWPLAILTIFCIIIIAYFIAQIIFRKLESNITAKQHPFTNAFIYALKKPIIFLFSLLICTFFVTIFQKSFGNNREFVLSWAALIRNLSIVITITWTVLRYISRTEYNLINFPSRKKPINHTTVLALGRLLKIIVFILTVLLLLVVLDKDVTGILTFSGASILGAGIAAKDMLANFFGGFMIFMDRQFSVGDLIRSPDKNIEGTVEHIGWRVTTIRTLQKLALYVPNAVFLTISIENESRARNRSIRQTIGLRYCDVTKVPVIMTKIEEMIEEHPGIDHNQLAYIVMNKFGTSSLDCLLSCYTKTTELVAFLKVQQDLLLKITNIVHQHNADIAFPTTTIDIPSDTLLSLARGNG